MRERQLLGRTMALIPRAPQDLGLGNPVLPVLGQLKCAFMARLTHLAPQVLLRAIGTDQTATHTYAAGEALSTSWTLQNFV